MGGFGSGRRFMQSTMETSSKIDIRYLRKTGRLDYDHDGGLSWTNNGRDAGSIRYRLRGSIMTLNYRHRSNKRAEWQTVTQTINITSTPCNYGGCRKWLECPRCYSRMAILVGHGKYFYCRKCYRLPYRSTLESETDRMYTKKHELGAAIFENYENGDGWLKKKGMHQKTFDRKLVEYRRLERQICQHVNKFLSATGHGF